MDMERTTSVATYAGSGTAFIGGLSANEFAALGGLAVAILAFAINVSITIYFKRQHLKLARDAIESGDAKIVLDGDEK